MRRPSAMLNLRISDFSVVSVACGKICVCILNFVQFGRFAADIWRYNDFQDGGRPACCIWEFLNFCHVSFALLNVCVCVPDFVIFHIYTAGMASNTALCTNVHRRDTPALPCMI